MRRATLKGGGAEIWGPLGVPAVWIEQTTYRLQSDCSTTELSRRFILQMNNGGDMTVVCGWGRHRERNPDCSESRGEPPHGQQRSRCFHSASADAGRAMGRGELEMQTTRLTVAAAALLLGSGDTLYTPQTIRPSDGHSLDALGHTWSFGKVQDAFTGFSLLKDGKPTSLHGIRLTWDGRTLTLTDHHPYPFDPGTGRPWKPPERTHNLTDRESGYANKMSQQGQLSPSWRGQLKQILPQHTGVIDSLRRIGAKLTGR